MQAPPAWGMFLGSLGLPELLFIILIAVLIFGGKRLGEIGKGLGAGIRNFRVALREDKRVEDDKSDPSS